MTRVMSSVGRGVTGSLDGGSIQIYEGSRILAEVRLPSPAFEPADDAFQAHAISEVVGTDDGVAETWVAMTAGGIPVLAGRVGEDMLSKQRYIARGAKVRIKSFTYRQA